MVDAIKFKECLKNLLGFREHYDSSVPALTPDLKISTSGEYYQDFHPALNLAIVSQSLESTQVLNDYLKTKVETAITQLGNDLTAKKISEGVKDIVFNDTLLSKIGWLNDKIIGEGRFVGFMFKPIPENGVNVTLQQIGFQFNGATNFDLYVYHSNTNEPEIIPISITDPKGWSNTDVNIVLTETSGTYYIGYYQNDIQANAINYTDFNWSIGPCTSCDGGSMQRVWNGAKRHLIFMPFYVPGPNLDPDRKMFDPKAVMIDYNKSWGMNFRVLVNCDLTDFYCRNKISLKEALGLKFAYLVIKDISFSQQYNYINEDIKHLIIRDLEGDKETNAVNLYARMKQAVRNVYIDTGNLSPTCLPCTEKGGTSYGHA